MGFARDANLKVCLPAPLALLRACPGGLLAIEMVVDVVLDDADP
jgi:hypothetical protein